MYLCLQLVFVVEREGALPSGNPTLTSSDFTRAVKLPTSHSCISAAFLPYTMPFFRIWDGRTSIDKSRFVFPGACRSLLLVPPPRVETKQ